MRASFLASASIMMMVPGVLPAEAGGFAVREQSAYGQGSSFAGMAAPGDSISSMFWNPAAVTSASGVTVEGNVTAVFPRSELDVDPTRSTLSSFGVAGSGGNVGEVGIVPGTYFAVPLTDEFYIGMSVTAPYALGTTSDVPWVGMFSHLDVCRGHECEEN
jgi:long-chain fatty acid transport protein